ncbi:MAG: hypothetical protein EPGJADBJ_05130 [Saprospiraceae bacterium]|nr:hypothetical protein [Saprospiraceae bacterium]
MFKLARPIFFHCQTPLHAGSGSDLGVVDLPIQRESHTAFPKIEASSLKGAIREDFETSAATQADKNNIQLAFGYDGGNSSNHEAPFTEAEDREYAGALGFTDARLLLFPVRSARGVFAWLICPAILKKFSHEANNICNLGDLSFPEISHADDGDVLTASDAIIANGKATLEEYHFTAKVEGNVTAAAKTLAAATGIAEIENRLGVVSDEVFRDFVQMSTEIITRIKIDNEKGTVQRGALFTEEYLPAESVLYALVMANPLFGTTKAKTGFTYKEEGKALGEAEKVMGYFMKGLRPYIQIGGNATLGKGIVKTAKITN